MRKKASCLIVALAIGGCGSELPPPAPSPAPEIVVVLAVGHTDDLGMEDDQTVVKFPDGSVRRRCGVGAASGR